MKRSQLIFVCNFIKTQRILMQFLSFIKNERHMRRYMNFIHRT